MFVGSFSWLTSNQYFVHAFIQFLMKCLRDRLFFVVETVFFRVIKFLIIHGLPLSKMTPQFQNNSLTLVHGDKVN